MGFQKIYLLGVDNTMTPSVHTANTEELHPHFYDEDKNENDERRKIMSSAWFDNDFDYHIGCVNKSYTAANAYAEKKGVKVFNATRGGKLEVFERVNFDSLFDEV